MARLFFSYAHADKDFRDRLERDLAMAKREGLIEPWHDRRIPPGAHVDQTISSHLETADVILLLVSPDFLASPYCYVEMQHALARRDAHEATVIPVILRPCEWQHAAFGRLNALPTDGKPISRWTDLDEAYLDVVSGIRRALEARDTGAFSARPSAPSPSAQPDPVPAAVPRTADIRSSNLRVTQTFSDQDQDDFLREAFDHLARFFENSAAELSRRTPDIEVRFRRIDADRFSCVAYRSGTPSSACTVAFTGRRGQGGGITFHANDSGATGTFNEALSVDADEQSLYLRPLGMQATRGGPPAGAKLTLEGGAEAFWALFMQPLQRKIRWDQMRRQ